MMRFDESRMHEGNIRELIRRYGNARDADEIRKIYNEVRERYEKEAVVKDFLPIIVMREVTKIFAGNSDA